MLTEREASAVDQLLSAEGAKREHLVVALSGAHAYGFPSPDSDLDLKSIHVAPTADLVGLVAVTFNTIRLQILTQRAEIEVSKLIGATDAFIRRPFYYLGMLQGLAGGAVAVAIVSAGLWLLNREVQVLAESYGSAYRLPLLSPGDAAALMAFAALIGWLGAYLSVNRHLRKMEPV